MLKSRCYLQHSTAYWVAETVVVIVVVIVEARLELKELVVEVLVI